MKVNESWGGQRRYAATADSVAIETDEDGFHLIVSTDEGETIDVRVQGIAEELLAAAMNEIAPWIAEREEARVELRRAVLNRGLER